MNILVLYGSHLTNVGNVRASLESIKMYSKNDVKFCNAVYGAFPNFSLLQFDCVIVHYSCFLYDEQIPSSFFLRNLEKYDGLKVVILQDEFDRTETMRRRVENLAPHLILTCARDEALPLVFPPERFGNVRIESQLTGYVIPLPEKIQKFIIPLHDRPIALGYRGRSIDAYLGELGFDKIEIGRRMRTICSKRGIPCDISWLEKDRLYGDSWFQFLGSCRAILGSESGSTVMDEFFQLRPVFNKLKMENPRINFQEYKPYMSGRCRPVNLGQISPRIFEAAAMKTPMILLEGSYSNIISPDVHYIPLRKDYKNIDSVLDILEDDNRLSQVAERAHNDLIQSDKYGYPYRIREIDNLIDELYASLPRRLRVEKKETFAAPYLIMGEVPTEEVWGAEHAKALERSFSTLVKPMRHVRHLSGNEPVMIYGCGKGGRLVASALAAGGRQIGGFIDSQRRGELNGLPILLPEDLATNYPRDIPIVIGSQYVYEIAHALLAVGFHHLFDARLLIKRMMREEMFNAPLPDLIISDP
ncbi:hypothetical protein [Azospirillum humicireducens]|uniref:hypothetical protein n=1 Tax=Azospirillum humicireducens TaxID=1226968 RepID=UPI0011B20EDF|nr:hypothetical protein [Azospirillum humicireducens]